MHGPIKITITAQDGTIIYKPISTYTDDDFEKVELDDRALPTLSMALSPDIAHGFREYEDAKALQEDLIEVYEGNDDMKKSRQDFLHQKFNMFNHILGESLEIQLQ